MDKNQYTERNIKRYSTSELEEGFITHFTTFFNSSANNFVLMAWAHFRGSSFYLGNVMIPILITLGVAAFMPIVVGFTWILFLALTFTGLATYGTVFFSIRKSTIIKNINLTTTETGPLYFATFVLLGVSLFVTINVIVCWLFILDNVGFLVTPDIFINDSTTGWDVSWIKVYSHPMLWFYWMEQVILCFSLSFFFEKVVETQKNFFMCVFVYILAGIFFSGIMAPGVYINSSNEVMTVTEDVPDSDLNGVKAVPMYLWGNELWIIGQFFPHFGANQLVASVAQASSTTTNEFGEIIQNKWADINVLRSLGDWKVRYYAFMPWIWMFILLYVASMLERYNKHSLN